MPLTYYHLDVNDYPLTFPDNLDAAPILIDKHTYIDDWIFNRMFAMAINIQSYLIAYKSTIEV